MYGNKPYSFKVLYSCGLCFSAIVSSQYRSLIFQNCPVDTLRPRSQYTKVNLATLVAPQECRLIRAVNFSIGFAITLVFGADTVRRKSGIAVSSIGSATVVNFFGDASVITRSPAVYTRSQLLLDPNVTKKIRRLKANDSDFFLEKMVVI